MADCSQAKIKILSKKQKRHAQSADERFNSYKLPTICSTIGALWLTASSVGIAFNLAPGFQNPTSFYLLTGTVDYFAIWFHTKRNNFKNIMQAAAAGDKQAQFNLNYCPIAVTIKPKKI